MKKKKVGKYIWDLFSWVVIIVLCLVGYGVFRWGGYRNTMVNNPWVIGIFFITCLAMVCVPEKMFDWRTEGCQKGTRIAVIRIVGILAILFVVYVKWA